MQYKKIFITGGAGYVGSRLVPILLKKGYYVTVYDIMYFGKNTLPNDVKLNVIQGDIRDIEKLKVSSKNHDVFLHLACISNDASFALDEQLSKSINLDCFKPMVLAAKNNGVKLFIYASTSSVYGISEARDIKEDHPLVPLTLYNDFKGQCEPLLLEETNSDFNAVIFRPATVCGYSNRQRFDLTVNILTNLAINKKEITVFGGNQLRPNLHILDYCNVVDLFMNVDIKLINNEIFNVGYDNLNINEIAKIVKTVVTREYNYSDIKIITTPSNDNRSYHINSDKIKNILNFKPELTIEDAVKELIEAFKENKFIDSLDNLDYFNVKKLKKIQAK